MDGIHFENAGANTNKYIQDMIDLDKQIYSIRFDNSKSREEILDEIVILFQKRNEIYNQIMKSRADELHSFVNSLNLPEIQIQPFYPVPNRCKFIVQNEHIVQIVNGEQAPAVNPWQKMLSKFVKKKEHSKKKRVYSQLSALEAEHLKIIENRKLIVEGQVENLNSKKNLNAFEIAEKCRLDSELADIENTLKTIKKK